MHVAAIPESQLDRLFQAIDAKDAARFVSFLTEDGEFRFGSAPPVRGREAAAAAVQGFFDSVDGISHTVAKVWRDEVSLVCEGEVCYRRHDGSEISLPFVDVFEMRDELISSYKIYMDLAPLFAQ